MLDISQEIWDIKINIWDTVILKWKTNPVYAIIMLNNRVGATLEKIVT